jgi:hypothetical protein
MVPAGNFVAPTQQMMLSDRFHAMVPERFARKEGEEIAYCQHCAMCFLCGGMWLPCFIAAETCGICKRPCG